MDEGILPKEGGDGMQPLTKAQMRTFASVYLRTMDPQQAALSIGAADAIRILAQKEVGQQIQTARQLLAEQFTPEDTVRRMVELAFGRANDCVRLALQEDVDIDSLDLSLLSEIRRNDKGTVEIRLIDRMRVLERLLSLERSSESEASAFFRAMQAACGEGTTLEESD